MVWSNWLGWCYLSNTIGVSCGTEKDYHRTLCGSWLNCLCFAANTKDVGVVSVKMDLLLGMVPRYVHEGTRTRGLRCVLQEVDADACRLYAYLVSCLLYKHESVPWDHQCRSRPSRGRAVCNWCLGPLSNEAFRSPAERGEGRGKREGRGGGHMETQR